MTIFTLNPKASPKFLVMLPDNICYPKMSVFLNYKIVKPSGFDIKDFAFQPIPVPKSGRIKKSVLVDVLKETNEYCETMGINVILVGHSDTWQEMTNKAKFTENFGKALKGSKFSYGSGKDKITIDFSSYYLIPLLNPILLNKYPNKATDIQKSLNVLSLIDSGKYNDTNKVEHTNVKLLDIKDIYDVLNSLVKEDKLFVDIETTGLKWYKDKLLTISLTPNGYNTYCIGIHEKYHNKDTYEKVIQLLQNFFNKFNGRLIGHNWLGFDQAFIVHEVMREGNFSIRQEPIINKFKIDDTLIMAYLLKNSTERVELGLKSLAYHYLGDWDKDIEQKDLYNYSFEDVATYNNLDVVATHFVYNDLYSQLEKENLIDVYNKFINIGYVILKMKMNGLRIDLAKVKQLYNDFENFIKEEETKLNENKFVKDTMLYLAYEKQKSDTRKNKKDFSFYIEKFNPNSNKQKQLLFFTAMGLPVVGKTKTGNPATDKKAIETWLNDPSINDDKKEVLMLIEEYQATEKIRNTYLANMLNDYVEVAPNDYRIFANFNQTGTISGRLSSSGTINFQTIPSGSKYGKLVKELFIPPNGYVLGGSDYSALEDRLMANASQDPNKIAPFVAGIDGHCLNAFSYFKNEMPDIKDRIEFFEKSNNYFKVVCDNDEVYYLGDADPLLYELKNIKDKEEIDQMTCKAGIINQIKIKYPDLRQKGKPYTFGFSYGAGEHKYGKEFYDAYWTTYKATKDYNDRVIKKAKAKGYIKSRYSGLILRVPDIFAKNEFDRAKAERVVTNFNIQSGNILTLYAMVCFQNFIEKNNLYDKIQIVNTVHDAIYLYIYKDSKLIKLVNDNLIKCMVKDYNKGLYDDVSVKLEAELDIGYNMANMLTLKNNVSIDDIKMFLSQIEENR